MHKKEEKNPVKIEKQNPQQGGTGIKGLKGWQRGRFKQKELTMMFKAMQLRAALYSNQEVASRRDSVIHQNKRPEIQKVSN